jgi:hypothetical protein
MAVLLAIWLLLAVYVKGDELGCLCEACWSGDDGTICGYPGATIMNSTDCNDCTATVCDLAFPEDNQPPSVSIFSFGCHAVDTDPWDGTWELDPCDNGCFYSPGMLGDCLPCCVEENCDCVHGSISITENDDGTMNMTIGTTHYPSTSYIFPHTGNAGYTSTGNVSGSVYDVTKDGDHMTFTQRLTVGTGYACTFTATRNPSTTNYLKLALLIGGVTLGALLLLIFLCCNPFKKCRKNKETAQIEGRPEGVPYKPMPSAPSETHAGINYTGNYNDL